MNDFLMLESGDHLYAISPSLVKRIAYAAGYFQAKWQSRYTEPLSDSDGLTNAYRWKFDSKSAEKGGRAAENAILHHPFFLRLQQDQKNGVCNNYDSDVARFRQELIELERSVQENRQMCWSLEQSAFRNTINQIQQNVQHGEKLKDGAVLLANGAVDVLAATTFALTGGTGAVPIKALAALAKGGIKYLETEKAGAATLTAVAEFAISIFPLPEKGTRHYVAMVVTQKKLQLASDTFIGVVEGKSFEDSALDAGFSQMLGLKFAGPDTKRITKFSRMFQDMDIPVSIRMKFSVNGPQLARKIGATLPIILNWNRSKDPMVFTNAMRKAKEVQTSPRIQVAEPLLSSYAILGPDMCYAN